MKKKAVTIEAEKLIGFLDQELKALPDNRIKNPVERDKNEITLLGDDLYSRQPREHPIFAHNTFNYALKPWYFR